MKKSLSLLVAIALVFSMFSSVAFAATTSAGQKLQDLGIIKGDQKGNLLEDQNWKRQDVAVLLSRLMGKETEAKNTAKSHTYADVRGTYYDGYLSWARENGYMQGHSATKFGFDDPITLKEFATVILRVLGYDTSDYSKIEELAVEVGLVEEGTDFSADAKRGETYDIIVIALDTEVAGTGKKLGTILGLPGYEVVDPAVTGATALNLKQVKVTFNKEVNEESAKTLSNYQVYNNEESENLVADGSVALQSDKSSVIITLGTALKNGQTAKIVVEGVKDNDGRVISKFEGSLNVQDNTVPTVVGVKVVGPRDIEVEFSEPVHYADDSVNKTDDFTVDNGGYFVTDVVVDGSKATVSTGLDMSEGDHKIRINGVHLSDYAGYKPAPVTIDFKLVWDKTAPVAKVLSASPSEVKIGFDKPVDNVLTSNVLFRHTYNNGTYEVSGDSGYVTANSSSTEFTINFGAAEKLVPLGSNSLYIAYADNNNGPFITDRWGNRFEATSLELSVSMDTTKPTVKEVKFVSTNELDIVFSESVEKDSAEDLDNYVVKDSAGSELEITLADRYENDKVRLTFKDANALSGGTYTIEVSGVKDTAVIKNVMDLYRTTITINDTVKPNVLAAKYTTDSNGNLVIYIPFSEQMKASTLTKSNIQKLDTNGKWVNLGSKDNLVIGSDLKSVTITLKDGEYSISNEKEVIRIGYVTDLAGNSLLSLTAVGYKDVAEGDADNGKFEVMEDAIAVEKAEAISKSRIKVTFDGRLASVHASDFVVYVDDGSDTKFADLKVVAHSVNKDGKSEVVFELSGKTMNTNVKDDNDNEFGLKVVSNTRTKSFLGKPVDLNTYNIADKIAPELVKAVVNSTGTEIELKFSEGLDGSKFANTLNGFSVSRGDLESVDYNRAASGVVVLKGKNFKAGSTTVSYNDVAGLTDASPNANKLASFSGKKTEAAPQQSQN